MKMVFYKCYKQVKQICTELNSTAIQPFETSVITKYITNEMNKMQQMRKCCTEKRTLKLHKYHK